MLNLLQNQLGQLAIALHLLSVALAAPAEYIILPPQPVEAVLEVKN